MFQTWMSEFQGLVEPAFGMNSRLNPLFLAAMIVIAFGLYLYRRPQGSFLAWLFPKKIYTHSSNMTDIKLWVVDLSITLTGVIKTTLLTSAVAYGISNAFGRSEAETGQYTPLIIAALILVTNDFCTYWVHRVHHEVKWVWPFHAVHHSAEVMTPITVYRKHPIYTILSKLVRAPILGVMQGLVVVLFVGQPSFTMIAGANIFYVVFNFIGSNFRHSHIWISYGRVLEHIFISPAQHQIHHSLARKHWHKNYGEVFAIWDWMFGTLYVTHGDENLEFGLSTEDGQRIEQPYPTLRSSLYRPLCESWNSLREPVDAVEARPPQLRSETL